MTRFLLVLLLSIISIFSRAQDQQLSWINKNAIQLPAEPSAKDFSFLAPELKNNLVIGLGEASHGTHEFFLQKRHLIEYLVTQLDYKLIGFEFDHQMMTPINQYLLDGKGDLKVLMTGFYLYNTEEIHELFTWIRSYNEKQKLTADKVSLFGFDDKAYFSDPYTRDQYMARDAIAIQEAAQKKAIIWTHNVHLGKDTTMAQFKALGFHLKEKYAERFYALAFDTFRGSVNMINDQTFELHQFQTQAASFSALFATANYPSFFISFEKSPLKGMRNNVTHLASNWTEMRMLPMKPGVDFDGLIFIRETAASKELK